MRSGQRGGSTPETNPLRHACGLVCARVLFVSPKKRRNPYGSRKTRHQATCASQEVFKAHQRLFSNQEQVVPVRTGSGESRGSLCVSRSARQKTAVPAIVDSTRGSGGAIERVDLRAADSRIEDGGCHAGPQGAGGHRGERCGGVRVAGGYGAGCGATGEKGESEEVRGHSWRAGVFFARLFLFCSRPGLWLHRSSWHARAHPKIRCDNCL